MAPTRRPGSAGRPPRRPIARRRVAEELREELTQTKGELAGVRHELDQLADDIQAKDRQMGRTQDDIGNTYDRVGGPYSNFKP